MVDFSLGGISQYFGGGSLTSIISTIVWFTIIVAVFAVIIIFVRNRIKYRYYCEVYKRRQFNWQTGNPESEKIQGKAGYFKQGDLPVFKIQYGLMPWQKVIIKKLPDPRYMQNKTAIYLQYNVGELVQAKKQIDWENSLITIEPVDSTTKAAAKAEMKEYSNILTVKNKLMENIGIISMGFILVAGIVAYYFISKACGA